MSYLGYSERKLVELAFYDDADAYEVDEGGIYFDKDSEKFIFASASGCSCWSGEWEVSKEYDSLGDLAKDLIDGDSDGNDIIAWGPSLVKAAKLIEEAKAAIRGGILAKPVVPPIENLKDVSVALKEVIEKSKDFNEYVENVTSLLARVDEAIER